MWHARGTARAMRPMAPSLRCTNPATRCTSAARARHRPARRADNTSRSDGAPDRRRDSSVRADCGALAQRQPALARLPLPHDALRASIGAEVDQRALGCAVEGPAPAVDAHVVAAFVAMVLEAAREQAPG